jgi:hypothetical protein
VDEYLHSQNKEKIFSRIFEGAFSDQKICCGCPHRYEREEKFMSLNLDVKPGSLQESLRDGRQKILILNLLKKGRVSQNCD